MTNPQTEPGEIETETETKIDQNIEAEEPVQETNEPLQDIAAKVPAKEGFSSITCC